MVRPQAPTIAITGANGFIGSALVSYFKEMEWEVLALTRTDKEYLPGIRHIQYDLNEPVNSSVLKNVDYIVHAAYIKKDRGNSRSLDLNIAGAKRLLTASRANKVKKNIFVSSMSAHDEALSSYGRQKLAIENLFNTRRDVSLRLGLVIGNGGIVQDMAHFMKTKHLVPMIGRGRQPIQIVSVNDLGNVIYKTIKKDMNGTLTIADPKVYSYKNFYKILSNHLNVCVVFLPVPFYILLFVLRISRMLHLSLSINEDSLLGLKKLTVVDTRKDLKKIGVSLSDLNTSLNKTDFS